MPSAIVLAIDGLGAASLGPYGNTWIETRAFNELAVESVVAERMFAQAATTKENYSCIWRGTNDGAPQSTDAASASVITRLNESGVSTRLLTDDPDLTDHPLAGSFAEQHEQLAAPAETLAAEWEQTHTARFFAESVSHIEAHRDNSLLWIHSRGLGNPWDAPQALRDRFAAEEDPEVFVPTTPPKCTLEKNFDPDVLHAIRCALAGQVTLIDYCLEIVHGLVAELAEATNSLFVVMGTRGFPLGEHLHVGWDSLSLYRELLHVPLMARFPQGQFAMQRMEGLGELRDVTQLLDQWFTDPTQAVMPNSAREYSLSKHNAETLLRTHQWSCRFPQLSERMEDDLVLAELYVKPDDLTEVNDLSGRCMDVVEAAWRFTKSCLATDQELELPDGLKDPPG